MDPYTDEESIKKPCGPPVKIKLPELLQKEYVKFFLSVKENYLKFELNAQLLSIEFPGKGKELERIQSMILPSVLELTNIWDRFSAGP